MMDDNKSEYILEGTERSL